MKKLLIKLFRTFAILNCVLRIAAAVIKL